MQDTMTVAEPTTDDEATEDLDRVEHEELDDEPGESGV
jgi:hypothetical protein